jgi:2,4-dienoyl-CoA reductase-like NADH-dependent reductase (Old Yellow Enzyme family)
MIEPRFDEFKSASEKALMLGSMSVGQDMSLQPFKQALGSTKLLTAGGYSPEDYAGAINSGTSDLVAFGRFFMYVGYAIQSLFEVPY